jgi:hypothetical protein
MQVPVADEPVTGALMEFPTRYVIRSTTAAVDPTHTSGV